MIEKQNGTVAKSEYPQHFNIMARNNEAIESKVCNGLVYNIVYDSSPESPREWDDFAKLQTTYTNEMNMDRDEVMNVLNRDGSFTESFEKKYICLPVYKFEHGGVDFSTTSYGCPWDSGLVGFIAVDKERVREMYNVKRITKKIVERVYEILNNTVKTYATYANGDVYGFTIEDLEGNRIDSCYGYYNIQEVYDELNYHAKTKLFK